jgi:hypothetical protein
MAKKKKFPKQPKASASEEVWKRWEARCKEVAAYNKKLKEAPKKKAAIKARVQSLKMKS